MVRPADAVRPGRELRRQFGTDDGFSDRFDEFFEGEVTEGPVADGVPTWAYNGRLNADAILDLMAEEAALDDEARDRVEEFAENTRFTLLVGKADHLPRAFQLDVSGEGLDFTGVAGSEAAQMTVSLRGSFTEWGKPVRVTAPGAYAPLAELYQQFLGF